MEKTQRCVFVFICICVHLYLSAQAQLFAVLNVGRSMALFQIVAIIVISLLIGIAPLIDVRYVKEKKTS